MRPIRDPRESRARTGTIVHDGRERTYRYSVAPRPAGEAAPRPLVVALHGGMGTGTGIARQGDWDRVAEREGFIALYPDGTTRAWNAGTCCGPPVRDGVDDVGFVLGAIAAVAVEHAIDPTRVYATGMSNGGMMAYRLACEAPETFAAIAPVGCSSTFAPGPRGPVSLLHVHGLRDDFVPFEGGFPRRTAQRHPPSYVPVDDVVRQFVEVNGCPGEPAVRTEGEVATTTWAPGPGGEAVELVTIAEGMHSWPGGHRMLRALDPPSPALDATAVIWRFFADHPASRAPSSQVNRPI